MDPEIKQALIDIVKSLTKLVEVVTRKIEEQKD